MRAHPPEASCLWATDVVLFLFLVGFSLSGFCRYLPLFGLCLKPVSQATIAGQAVRALSGRGMGLFRDCKPSLGSSLVPAQIACAVQCCVLGVLLAWPLLSADAERIPLQAPLQAPGGGCCWSLSHTHHPAPGGVLLCPQLVLWAGKMSAAWPS